jgi:hypothetical protein
MDFWREAQSVQVREDLSAFLLAASRDFRENPGNWENRSISDFLEAMSAWVLDCDEFFRARGESFPPDDTWPTVAKLVAAARVYE